MHGELGENITALRDITDTQVGDFIGFTAHNLSALPHHRALTNHHAHDGLGGGGAARAIAPEQRDDFALAHLQLDAMQHMALAIKRL